MHAMTQIQQSHAKHIAFQRLQNMHLAIQDEYVASRRPVNTHPEVLHQFPSGNQTSHAKCARCRRHKVL